LDYVVAVVPVLRVDVVGAVHLRVVVVVVVAVAVVAVAVLAVVMVGFCFVGLKVVVVGVMSEPCLRMVLPLLVWMVVLEQTELGPIQFQVRCDRVVVLVRCRTVFLSS